MDYERNQYQNNGMPPVPSSGGYYGTGTPKKRRGGTGWLIFFTVLLVVTTAAAIFMKNYEITLQNVGSSVSLKVSRKGAEIPQAEPPQDTQETLPPGKQEAPSADLQETTEDGEKTQPETEKAEKPNASANSENAAELEISDFVPTRQETAQRPGNPLTLQQVYKKMIPSVVSIISVSRYGTGSGTGIIMSRDGYIITNHHVVEGGETWTVILHDERELTAELVGADAVSDLAVLKIEATGLTPAEFGDSDQVEVGDTVVAIGDPLGIELRGTMTDGIISAINRDVTTNGRTLTLLQTNAELNNGNSGGPLINVYGQVIGVNTMKMGSYNSSSVEGLGFAIPISSAKPIVDELIEKGYVSGRPAIGIQGDAVPGYARIYYNLPEGVYVAYVYENSDAYAKGLQEGDIITAIDGVSITSMDELNTVKNQHTAGDVVNITVYRSRRYYSVDIELMDQNDAD